MALKQTYISPRWSSELPYCSMPMTFDTYSKCSYGCLYCFSFFQKSHRNATYLNGQPQSVNPNSVKALFDIALKGKGGRIRTSQRQFIPYIQDRRIMQWGGLADEFDEYERHNAVTLELLEYFDSIDYPLSLSTKGTWWTEDDRYMRLFAKHAHNWHVKITIITANDIMARQMERGAPPSSERIKAVKRLADLGIHVTLRLRPYIIGLSDDYEKLIKAVAKAGADSVTTEFLRIESRADKRLKERYDAMSKIVGYDLFSFYMKNSRANGIKRLSRKLKLPTVIEMQKLVHSLGMKFYASDTYLKDFCDSCNCCGVPPEWHSSFKGHIGEAILIAQENGEVRYSDIEPHQSRYFSFDWNRAEQFNVSQTRNRALYMGATMKEWLRTKWNNTGSFTAPAHGYGDILEAAGNDENGNVIYKYAGRKAAAKCPRE